MTLEQLKLLLQSIKNDDPTSISILQTVIGYLLAYSPTADEKAALAGTNGAPSDTNRYVTDSDPRLTGGGGGGITSLTGDVTTVGTGPAAATVVRLQGRNVNASAPSVNNVLTWDGSAWSPVALPADQDHFAPKYLVGNFNAGDTAPDSIAAGFRYYQDTGNGAGIIQALSDAGADPSKPGDVYIRPGQYLISQTLIVPPNVKVSGAGQGVTVLISSTNNLAGPVFSLDDGVVLRDLSIFHDEPGTSGTQYGVVDLRVPGASALCENVSVQSVSAAPGDQTIAGCFMVRSTAASDEIKLTCVRCSALYGDNSTAAYQTNLVGYRSQYGSLELVDCTSDFSGTPTGYAVVCVTSNVLSRIVVRGGNFRCNFGGVFMESGVVGPTLLVSGLTILGALDAAPGECVGVGTLGHVHAVISDNEITLAGGSGACVYFFPTVDAQNTGRVVGNNLLATGNVRAWRSYNAGYHVFLGNTYRSQNAPTSTPVTSPNDEAAHNIIIT